MSDAATLSAPETPQIMNPAPSVANGKFGIWLFLASEVMFFTGLIGAYIVLRASHPDWTSMLFKSGTEMTGDNRYLNVPLTALNTFFLICSSVTMVFALEGAKQGNHKKLLKFLWATIGIGIVFLGIQAYEYNQLINHENFKASTSIFSSTFFTMTGFHGMHVLGGVIWMTVIALGATFQGRFSKGDSYPVEYVGLYWHFVDLVWIILFTIVYLM